MNFAEVAPVLQAIGMAEAEGGPLDPAAMSEDLGISVGELQQRLGQLHAFGLVLLGEPDELPPLLLPAGRQYLAIRGEVDPHALGFLGRSIEDLHARRALLAGGSILVDEFRTALIAGTAVEYTRDLVPPAFALAVDDKVALDMFAASVALMARLSAGEPAACVAEEVIAVSLIDQARMWLELQAGTGEISDAAAATATDCLPGLFNLFEDDDVLRLFDMREPSDAAVDRHAPLSRHLGVADQRVEAWFAPFGGVPPTGYLHDPPPR